MTKAAELKLYSDLTSRKVHTHVINGIRIRTNLTTEDLCNPKLWTMRSVDAWAHAIQAQVA